MRNIRKFQQGGTTDKVKQFRDKHPILDISAGFIPGVGIAQDAQDLYYSAKNKNYGGMALASLGLLTLGLPIGKIGKLRKLSKIDDLVDVGGGLGKASRKSSKIKKVMDEPLPEKLAQNGWTVAEDGAFVNDKGQRFIRDKQTQRLISEDSFNKYREIEKNKKELKKAEIAKEKDFEKMVDNFTEESGLDFSLRNWEFLAKGHKMTDVEKHIYKTQALPNFIQTYRDLASQGKLIKKNGKWYGWFDEPVSSQVNDKLPILKKNWEKGFRQLQGETGAMTYVIMNSPQTKGKFLYNGITMRQGIPVIKETASGTKIRAKHNFENGIGNQEYEKWFDSDISGSQHYAGKDGLEIYGVPIKPSLLFPKANDEVTLIKRQTVNPSSNSWNGTPNSWIGEFLEKHPEKRVHVSEGPLIDTAASKGVGYPVKGVFTIVGQNIPVKSIFGGTGMYDIKGSNLFKPFMQYAAPIGLASTIGYKTLKDDD